MYTYAGPPDCSAPTSSLTVGGGRDPELEGRHVLARWMAGWMNGGAVTLTIQATYSLPISQMRKTEHQVAQGPVRWATRRGHTGAGESGILNAGGGWFTLVHLGPRTED